MPDKVESVLNIIFIWSVYLETVTKTAKSTKFNNAHSTSNIVLL